MSAEIGLLEFAAGALVVIGIFAALMIWAVFPLLPLAVVGVAYRLLRYGVPAAYRVAVSTEEALVRVLRWALFPVAVWTLRSASPAYASRKDGNRRR